MSIRTRIAPSPTGPLHVGTARAALFNELFARQNNGSFILRIEDTDRERSTKEHEENIIRAFEWLGLQWQEGPDIGGKKKPYRQSQRTDRYQAALEKLIADNKAYREENSEAIRFKVSKEEVKFNDLIRGEVTVSPDSWGGDFIIARSITNPLYHIAVVVDDADMEITHVIRGEDHLTNTARHILLQRALGFDQPKYAHLPLLLDENRKKFSKRSGEVSLLNYRDQGFLPQAMLNYLALLGWNPDSDEEFFTHDELIERFSLENVQKGGAVFSIDKLISFNKEYIRRLSPEEFYDEAKPFMKKAGIDIEDKTYWQKALATEQERASTLAELPKLTDFYRTDWTPQYQPQNLIWNKSDRPATIDLLKKLSNKLTEIPEEKYREDELQNILLTWIDEGELGRGDVLWPMRYALTGKDKSPGPFEVASVLKKEKTLDRINKAVTKLEQTETTNQ